MKKEIDVKSFHCKHKLEIKRFFLNACICTKAIVGTHTPGLFNNYRYTITLDLFLWTGIMIGVETGHCIKEVHA